MVELTKSMKLARLIFLATLLYFPLLLVSQELTVITTERSDGTIWEQFEVLKKRKTIKSGFYKRFYPDGQVNLNANYQDNLLNGLFESKHPNGHFAASGNYMAGKKSGDWIYSDAEGTVTVKGTFKEDLEEGIWSINNPEGYHITANYQAGKLNGSWELNLNDQLLATSNFEDGLPRAGSLKLATDSVYRYLDSLYVAPEINAFFLLLKFSDQVRINGPMPDEPRFFCGNQAVRDYLSDYVKLPLSVFQANNGSGVPKKTCYVQIIVSQFGTIEKVSILNSFSKDLDREIIQSIREMPLWIPAINRNIPVRSILTIPYSFQSFIVR